MILTVGLVDAGRAFFQYNGVSAAARYAARWGSVVGGTCSSNNSDQSVTDWCNQLAGQSANFWTQYGNKPLEGPAPATCPSYSSGPTDYYTAADPDNDSDVDVGGSGDTDSDANKATSIVGAVAQHFDTSDTAPSGGNAWSFITGAFTPGFDLSKLEVCIELSTTRPVPGPGDTVRVHVYYPFTAVSAVLPTSGLELNATSQYQVE